MNNSFFDNVGDDQEGFCMAAAADVFHPLNEVEEYSISFSPLNYPYNYYLETMFNDDDYINMVEYFQDHHQDMDINISDYPILNDDDDDDDDDDEDGDHMTISRNDTIPLLPTSLVLPTKEIFMDNKELIWFHLLMAYKEAMEMGQEDLAEVIEKRIGDKVCPVGDTTLERLMYYVFQTLDRSHDYFYYLKQESLKNFFPAFGTFYQIFPNGKFAHFVANLAILEAMPQNYDSGVVVIRIFDFDIGEGIQWPSLIGSIVSNNDGQEKIIREVILTSVKLDHDSSDQWKFEDTKRRLRDHAMAYGLKLTVEEMELRNLERCLINIGEILRVEYEYQWFVFNCMVGLPHMGRVRSRKNVIEFLNSAQNFLQKCNINNGSDMPGGIVILGDGDSWEKVKNASNYGAFLDGNMAHYQALLDSIKCNFPIRLGEARVAMECLFVAPFVSSRRWAKQWEEKKKLCGNYYLEPGRSTVMGLEGWKLREDKVMEARELVARSVDGGEYGVSINDAGDRNEIVMDWRGIPMVTVSCWRSNQII